MLEEITSMSNRELLAMIKQVEDNLDKEDISEEDYPFILQLYSDLLDEEHNRKIAKRRIKLKRYEKTIGSLFYKLRKKGDYPD